MSDLISVIICTRNRAASLSKALDSLLCQEKESVWDYEIIVVDNNSSDNTKETVEGYISSFNGKLRYVHEPMQGKPFALNRGIKEAKGDIIAFTDDDVTIDRHWLKNTVACFKQHGCDGIGGRVLPVYPEKTPAWVKENPHQAAGSVVIYDHGEQTQEYEASMELFIGANYAFRREMFTQCGLFRTDFKFDGFAIGEDREFIQRLIKAGKSLYYCGQAVVWHPVDLKRLGFRYLARWHFNVGKIAAKKEYEEHGAGITLLGGVPQYLLRGVVEDAALLLFFCWHRPKFQRNFQALFRKIGMIAEYRAMRRVPGDARHA